MRLHSLTNETKVKVAFVLFSTVLAALGAARMYWSWPDAPWQSSLWFIGDLNHFLKGDYGNVTWFAFGEPWSMNGYRWFQYLSAQFFHFDTRLENLVYFFLTYVLSLLVGLAALGSSKRGTAGGVTWIVFLIPPVIMSLSGAGSRGMELGTFTGLVLVVLLFIYISSERRKFYFEIISSVLAFVSTFVFLGGYVAGATFSLLITTFLYSRYRHRKPRVLYQLIFASAVTSLATVGHFLTTLAKSIESTASPFSALVNQLSDDLLFPLKYLFWGSANSIMSANTRDMLGTDGSWLLVFGGCVIVGITVFAFARQSLANTQLPPAAFLLVFYGAGTALLLLVYRNTSSDYLLSPWYSLHFKVALAGALWLLAIKAVQKKSLGNLSTHVASSAAVVLIVLVVISNWIQFARGDSERAYFLNVASAALIPSTLAVPAGETYTQLVLPLEESREALGVLQEHKLSVFNNPEGNLVKIFGGLPSAVTLPTLPADHWAGKQIDIQPIRENCADLRIEVQKNVEIPDQVLDIKDTNGLHETYAVDEGLVLSSKTLNGNEALQLTFGSTWVPSKTSGSADTRELSNIVLITCAN
jgi:hypothetical protein